jgi:hypothetical protein
LHRIGRHRGSRTRVEFEMFKEIYGHVSKLRSPRFKLICVMYLHCYLCMPTGLQ